jgi:hypothetical protein
MVSHRGWFETPIHPVQWCKLAGAMLTLARTVRMVLD